MSSNHKIKIIGSTSKENFYCQICSYPLVSKEDFESDSAYNCCIECFLEFGQSRRNEWKNGWRPNKTEINRYISIRKKLYKKINKEK